MGLITKVITNKQKIYAGFLNFPKVKGALQKINKPEISIDYKFIELVKIGEQLHQATNLLDIACSIIFWNEDYNLVTNYFEFLKNYQPLEIIDY